MGKDKSLQTPLCQLSPNGMRRKRKEKRDSADKPDPIAYIALCIDRLPIYCNPLLLLPQATLHRKPLRRATLGVGSNWAATSAGQAGVMRPAPTSKNESKSHFSKLRKAVRTTETRVSTPLRENFCTTETRVFEHF